MAAPAPHRVLRLLVELAGAPAADAGALQAAAQRQLLQRLLPVIDRLCSQLADAGTVQRIDRLEIDLGAWPQAAWADAGDDAQALVAQFEATLARQLGQALQTAVPVQTDAELVASCLHTGQLPWWADAADRSALQRALAALLAQPVRHGLAWLPPADADAPALQRLVAALDDAQLADLADRLQRPQGGAGSQGLQGQQGRQGVVALPWPALLGSIAQALGLAPGRLRHAWWREVLAAALQPAQADGRAWVTALQRLPARLGQGAAVLAPAWRRALDQAATQPDGPADATALAPLWRAFDQAWPAGRGGDSAAAAASTEAALAATAAALAALAALADRLAQRAPGDLLRAWLPWLQALRQQPQPDAARRLAAALAGGAPADQATAAVQDWLSAVQPPAGAALPQPSAAAAAATLAALLLTPARRPAPPAPPDAPAAPGPPNPLNPFASPSPGLPPAEALYLANAGLVLLWPFLQPFADRLGLLQDRQFRSPAHALRLAVLLQVLATGDAEPPEFQLPLNKLLCGLPLDMPLLLDDPLRSDELDECSALLAAVVLAAPVLRQMSADGLRQAFLQRAGQLSTQDGHWLLRVERAAHDLVLDRFPWSAAIVRLPWMPRLLQVQW